MKIFKNKGFTLVELLVVIAIIAILAAVVILIINPAELTKRSRDATRLSDFSNLQNAINVAVQEATASGLATVLCVGVAAPCGPYHSSVGTRIPDGTGWVKVNLSTSTSVSVPTLPVDGLNNSDNHYTYCAAVSGWVLKTKLESAQFAIKMTQDGGLSAIEYEVGSDLSLADDTACVYAY